MKTYTEEITPQVAKAYLQKNTSNRHIRESFVRYLANEMAAGRWKLTNQGIAFFKDGTLADGQHRLSAVVMSGSTVQMQVTRGMDTDAMPTIDTGVKRSIADYFHLHLGIKDANAMTAAARQILLTFFNYQSYQYPPQVVKLILEYYHEDIPAAIAAARSYRPANKAWIIGTLAIARHRHVAAIDEFLTQLATGELIRAGNPAHTMREWLISDSEHLRGGFRRGRSEAAFNILFHAVSGSTCKVARVGKQGTNYFIGQEKKLIETVRPEISYLFKR
jgi:hypothetical protein